MLDIVPTVSIKDLHTRLGFSKKIKYRKSLFTKPLSEFEMDKEDSHILRYLYHNFPIRRHLEFGTWQGKGVLYCLEESNASVWTINLLEGEQRADGSWAYSEYLPENHNLPVWSRKIKSASEQDRQDSEFQTDSLGFIGRYYLEKRLGSRVCQIYCDSKEWDISNYPEGFFDSVLIDGGHTEDVIINDTRKAFKLLRPGGIIVWHDFCPDKEVLTQCSSTRGTFDAISNNIDEIMDNMHDIFWIDPSWILFGIYGRSSYKKIHQFTDITTISQNEYITEQNKKIETLENTHESRVKSTEKEIFDKSENINSFNMELKKKNQIINSLQTEIAKKDDTIENMLTELLDRDNQIKTYNMELNNKEKNINSLKSSISEKDSEIESSQSLIYQKGNEINNLQSVISEKDNDIYSLQAEINQIKSKIWYRVFKKFL